MHIRFFLIQTKDLTTIPLDHIKPKILMLMKINNKINITTSNIIKININNHNNNKILKT